MFGFEVVISVWFMFLEGFFSIFLVWLVVMVRFFDILRVDWVLEKVVIF